MTVRRVGHKGADHIAPGNTPASFDAALACGVDMIEFDVLPEDREAPARRGCCSPTTTGTGLDAPHARAGAGAPRLAAFDGVELDVDLKMPGYEERVLEALRRFGLVERALVSTQYMRSLVASARARAGAAARLVGPARAQATTRLVLALPARRAAYLRRRSRGRRGHIGAGRCDALMAHWRLVTPRSSRRPRRRRRALRVDRRRRRRIRRLEALGVTGVITNDPRLFAQLPRAQVAAEARRVGADVARWPASVIAACSATRRPAPPEITTPRRMPRPLGGELKLQPDSTRPAAPSASRSRRRRHRHSPRLSRYWTRKRIDTRAARGRASTPRMPIVSGAPRCRRR